MHKKSEQSKEQRPLAQKKHYDETLISLELDYPLLANYSFSSRAKNQAPTTIHTSPANSHFA